MLLSSSSQQLSHPGGVPLNPIEMIRSSLTNVQPTLRRLHVDREANSYATRMCTLAYRSFIGRGYLLIIIIVPNNRVECGLYHYI